VVRCPHPTAWVCASPACVLGLPLAACCAVSRQTQARPIPVPCASVHAWGLRPRRVGVTLALTGYTMLPSVCSDHVGTQQSPYFEAQYPACTSPCQRFADAVTDACA
jgi:hypothetical protein